MTVRCLLCLVLLLTAVVAPACAARNASTIPDDFNVYWKDQDDSPELDDEVYVGAPAPVADDVADEEYDYALLPQVVKHRGWWLSYSGELIEDVLSNALMQKPAATDEELLIAVEYYSERDTFYDFT